KKKKKKKNASKKYNSRRKTYKQQIKVEHAFRNPVGHVVIAVGGDLNSLLVRTFLFLFAALFFSVFPLELHTRTSCAGLAIIQHFYPDYVYKSERLLNN
ncbi:hypothetical protein, partial [Escherichia coli]|uniref:hypothetical protein n=1 Tax=Escherichia coli TaxID=562 RepID=UPI0010CB0D09